MVVSDLEAVCRSEAQRVLTYLRGNRKFGSLSRGWRELEEESPVRLLNEWRFSREPTPGALLAPLLQIVRSPEFAGPSTYVALEASLAVVRAICDQPEAGPLAATLAQVSNAVVDCVFEETHAQMDEATTAQMISVLRACAEWPAGVDAAAFPASDRVRAFVKVLSLWSHYKQSPMLRGCAQEALFRMLDVACDHLEAMHEFLSLFFERVTIEVDAGGLAAERALLHVRCLQRLTMHPVARRMSTSDGPSCHFFQSSVPLVLMSIGDQFGASISVLSMLLPVVNRIVWLCVDQWRPEGKLETSSRSLGALQVEALVSSVYLRALGRAVEPLHAKEGEKAALSLEEGTELLVVLLEALCDLLQADTVRALWFSFDSDWRRPALLEQVIGRVVDLFRDLHQQTERPLPAHVVHLSTTVLVRIISCFVCDDDACPAPEKEAEELARLKEQWRRREVATAMMAKLEDSPKKGRAALEASGLLDFLELPSGLPEAQMADGTPHEEWAVKMVWVLRCLNHLIPYPAVGEFFGQPKPDSEHALAAFVETFDCGRWDIDQALRCFLQAFLLPKEAQQIDRVLKIFAHTYYRKHMEYCDSSGEVGAGYLKHPDAAYTLAFSVILLNSDQHNPQVKRRMTVNNFVSNNRGINEGENIPEDVQTRIFESIRLNEIKTPDNGSLIHGLSPARWADMMQLIQRGYRDNSLARGQDGSRAYARHFLERVGERVRLALENALAMDLSGHSDALQGLGQLLHITAGCPEADSMAEGLFFFGMEVFHEHQQRVALGRASACLMVLFKTSVLALSNMSTKQLHMMVYLTVQFALYGLVDKVLPPAEFTLSRLLRIPALMVDPPTGVVYSFLRKISTAPFKMLSYAEDGEPGAKAVAPVASGAPSSSPTAGAAPVGTPPDASPAQQSAASTGAATQEQNATDAASQCSDAIGSPSKRPSATATVGESPSADGDVPPVEHQISAEASLLDDPLRPQIERAFKASGLDVFIRSLVGVWQPADSTSSWSSSPSKLAVVANEKQWTEPEKAVATQVSMSYLSSLFLALRMSGGAKVAKDQDQPWWPEPPAPPAMGAPQGLLLPKRTLSLNVLDGYETLRLALRLTASTLGQRQAPGLPWDPVAVQELSVCAHVGLFHTLRRPDLCERTLRMGIIALFQVATVFLVLRSPEGPVVSVGWPTRLLDIMVRRVEAEPQFLVPVSKVCLECVRSFISEVAKSGRSLDKLELWRQLLQLLLKAAPTPARALWPGTRDREISDSQQQLWKDGIVWVLGHPHLLDCLGSDADAGTDKGAQQEGSQFWAWASNELNSLAQEMAAGNRQMALRLLLDGYRSLLDSISHIYTPGEYELLEATVDNGSLEPAIKDSLDSTGEPAPPHTRVAPASSTEAVAAVAAVDPRRLATQSESWARVAIALLSHIGPSLGRVQVEEPDLQLVPLLKHTMLSVRVPSLFSTTPQGPYWARLVLEKVVSMLTGPVTSGAPLHMVRDAVSLVAKFFLQNLQTLQRHDCFGQLWLMVLRLMLIFIKRGSDESDTELEEIATETLKNLLQILLSAGVLGFIGPMGAGPAGDASKYPVWWQMTWVDLDKSLPGFCEEFSRCCVGLDRGAAFEQAAATAAGTAAAESSHPSAAIVAPQPEDPVAAARSVPSTAHPEKALAQGAAAPAETVAAASAEAAAPAEVESPAEAATLAETTVVTDQVEAAIVEAANGVTVRTAEDGEAVRPVEAALAEASEAAGAAELNAEAPQADAHSGNAEWAQLAAATTTEATPSEVTASKEPEPTAAPERAASAADTLPAAQEVAAPITAEEAEAPQAEAHSGNAEGAPPASDTGTEASATEVTGSGQPAPATAPERAASGPSILPAEVRAETNVADAGSSSALQRGSSAPAPDSDIVARAKAKAEELMAKATAAAEAAAAQVQSNKLQPHGRAAPGAEVRGGASDELSRILSRRRMQSEEGASQQEESPASETGGGSEAKNETSWF